MINITSNGNLDVFAPNAKEITMAIYCKFCGLPLLEEKDIQAKK